MNEFTEGQNHRAMGYSVHYNPYRNKGTAKQYLDWIRGWESV